MNQDATCSDCGKTRTIMDSEMIFGMKVGFEADDPETMWFLNHPPLCFECHVESVGLA